MALQVELNFKQRNATRLFTAVGGLIAYLMVKNSTSLSMALGAILALMFRNTTLVFVLFKTVGRDIVAATRFLMTNIYLFYIEKKHWPVGRIFQQRCREHPQKPCFLIDDRKLTFQDVEDYSNKVGTYFKDKGYGRGDCVALMMATRPEYIAIWLGLSKIGITTALINVNLRKDCLLHCIKVAKAKAVILGTELVQAFSDISEQDEIKSLPIYQFSDEEQRANANLKVKQGACDLTGDLEKQKPKDLTDYMNECQLSDELLYVYTSGTTGMPKAAVITHLRYIFLSAAFYYMCDIRKNDIIYNVLPLHHTVGGVGGVGSALIFGCTVALRQKFSASNFWKDCNKFNATCAQYIGEMCRYLLNTPTSPKDTQHNLRLMYGNGLRSQIWSQFATRFNIPSIAEFYGSTEGNSNLVNTANKVGAIGFIPITVRNIFPAQLIRVDEETGEPLRTSKGFCTRCDFGETGLMVGRINPRRAVTAFEGYADKEASEKKLIRNVFKKGDVYFNSGDMLVQDIYGYFYFKDRTGDTFRWRGENVATQEVEAIITNVIGLEDCVVYGVEIPHVEGKAGMAAIVDPDRKIDLQHLSIGIRASLPAYAQPLFVRVINQILLTATFKMQKRDLMLEGFNMDLIKDPLYYLNGDGIYKPLTREQYESLLKGTAGL